MFFPDYSFVTLEKDKSIAFILPDHTGLVYKADNSFPIHTMGHWTEIAKKVTEKKLQPIATIFANTDGLCSVNILESNGLNVSTGSKLKTQLEKMLGMDMAKPIQDQKIGVVNRAIYFIGKEKTFSHCRAMADLQVNLGFISTMGSLNVPALPLPNVPDSNDDPIDTSVSSDSVDVDGDLLITKAHYKEWFKANGIKYRSKATLAELIELYEENVTIPNETVENSTLESVTV